METNSLRIHLQNELISRCRINNQYSLRSFAKFLGIEPSALSQILRGKRTLTRKMAIRLSNKLDINPAKLGQFKEIKDNNQQGPFSELTADLFQVISDWYYFAILELMQTENFQNDPKWAD